MTPMLSVEFRSEPLESKTAKACVAAYYAELAIRFEGGFDPQAKAYSGADSDTPPQVHFVVGWVGDRAVACGSLVWNDKTVGEIKRMWVAPDARGAGIARRLLDHLEDLARKEGLAAVRLDTNKELSAAQALYLSSGYSSIPRYNDNPYAHHWFGKTLRNDAFRR